MVLLCDVLINNIEMNHVRVALVRTRKELKHQLMAKKLLDFRYTFGYLYLSYFSQRANTSNFLLNQVEYHFVIFVIVYLLHAAVMQHSTSANSIFTIGKSFPKSGMFQNFFIFGILDYWWISNMFVW